MDGSTILLKLIGNVVLLLWGMRTVQNGVERAFGSDLRRVLGRTLRNRFAAIGAGALVTMLLQSSTATAMMVTSFAARGAIDLIPAMSVMLGANIGTALIAKVLSFDVSLVSPLLMLSGYVAFRASPGSRFKDVGRIGIGLGLMLLSLHLMVEAIQPVGASAVFKDVLSLITGDPVLDVMLAAVFTFAAHSSVATMLLLVPICNEHAVTPIAALALALGINLGGALPPVLETSAKNPASRRVPFGNLLFRAAGCVVMLPLLGWLAPLTFGHGASGGAAVTTFHLAFNVMLALAGAVLLRPVARLLKLLFADKQDVEAGGARPLFLQPEALATPYRALGNAAREILRMGDLVAALLDLAATSLQTSGQRATQAERLGHDLDALHEAVKAYLARLEPSGMTESDATRLSDLIEFAVNLDHAGGILERRATHIADSISAAAATSRGSAASRLLERVKRNLELAMSVMMTEDPRGARELLNAKREINNLERAASRKHLAGLGGASPERLDASTLYVATLRDLRQVDSHLASIGYAVLDTYEREADPAGASSGAGTTEELVG